MKKIIITALLLISFFAFPIFSHAAYIIHLKNGGQYVTTKYWEEDNQIKFFVSGGTMGIDRDTVKKIEKSTVVENEDVYETKKSALPPAIVEKKPSILGAPMIDKKENLKKDQNLMQEFNGLKKKFELRKSMAINELKDLRNALTVLRDKIDLNQQKDDFHEESDNIKYMIYLMNDYIIEKSTAR